MDECTWLGHWMPKCRTTHLHACSRFSLLEIPRCQLRGALANHSLDHGFAHRRCRLQHLPRPPVATRRRHIPHRPCSWLLYFPRRHLDHERPHPSQRSLHGIFQLRRMAHHWSFHSCRHYHAAVVLPRYISSLFILNNQGLANSWKVPTPALICPKN